MLNRNGVGFLAVSVVGIAFVITLLTMFPFPSYSEKDDQQLRISEQSESTLLIPEVTMGEKPQRYVHNWDDNPVAYVPESTTVDVSIFARKLPTVETLRQYSHNWDDNPVAYLPESTMGE